MDWSTDYAGLEIVRGTEWSVWSLWEAQKWLGDPHWQPFDEELIRMLQDALRGLVIGPRQVHLSAEQC